MIRVDLVDRIHKKVDLPKKEIVTIVEIAFGIIKETLQRVDKIVISKFGNFIIRNKRPRRGRNPQTGEDLEITARRVLAFKSSELLKGSLNSSKETATSRQE